MRASQFFISTLKEAPADAEIPSQEYTIRAGLIKKLAADPELCKCIAVNAEREIPVYSWREIAEQFDEYFSELTSERKL